MVTPVCTRVSRVRTGKMKNPAAQTLGTCLVDMLFSFPSLQGVREQSHTAQANTAWSPDYLPASPFSLCSPCPRSWWVQLVSGCRPPPTQEPNSLPLQTLCHPCGPMSFLDKSPGFPFRRTENRHASLLRSSSIFQDVPADDASLRLSTCRQVFLQAPDVTIFRRGRQNFLHLRFNWYFFSS